MLNPENSASYATIRSPIIGTSSQIRRRSESEISIDSNSDFFNRIGANLTKSPTRAGHSEGQVFG